MTHEVNINLAKILKKNNLIHSQMTLNGYVDYIEFENISISASYLFLSFSSTIVAIISIENAPVLKN